MRMQPNYRSVAQRVTEEKKKKKKINTKGKNLDKTLEMVCYWRNFTLSAGCCLAAGMNEKTVLGGAGRSY